MYDFGWWVSWWGDGVSPAGLIGPRRGLMNLVPSYVEMGDRVFCLLDVGGRRAYFALDTVTTIEPRRHGCVVWCGGHCFEFGAAAEMVFASMAEAAKGMGAADV